MSITTQHTQEQLSRAYVVAVAGVTGVNLAGTREHDYGVDGTFRPVIVRQNADRQTVRAETGYSVDFQLKASTDCGDDGTRVWYDCDADAYNKLVGQNGRNGAAPVLLLVLCQPREANEWVDVSESGLLMRGVCYWVYLTGVTTANRRNKRVELLRSQRFTPDALRGIIERVEGGNKP